MTPTEYAKLRFFSPKPKIGCLSSIQKMGQETLNPSPAARAVDLQLTTCEPSNAPAVDLDIYDTQPRAGTARDFVFYLSQQKYKIASYKTAQTLTAHVKLTAPL